MAPALLIAIGAMWFTVAVLFLGKGEPKGTGAITAFVGFITILAAVILAAFLKDPFLAGLLFAHGIFYSSVAYALLAGLEDLRSTGNVALYTCIVSVIYTVFAFTGGPQIGVDPATTKPIFLVGPSSYLAFGCAGYAVLTFMVWLNAYGKFPSSILAYSLLVWTVLGLWVPAFYLMLTGGLPKLLGSF